MLNDEYNDWAAEHGEPERIGEHERLIRYANGIEEREATEDDGPNEE